MAERPANPARPVAAVLATIPGLSNPVALQALAGGLVSDSWLIVDRGQQMVLRIDQPLARTLSLNRVAELDVLEAVAAAGIGPEALWADPSAGLLLTRFMPGDTWALAHTGDPRCLEQLASTLRTLYALPAAGVAFHPGAAARHYAQTIGTDAARQQAERANQLFEQLRAYNPKPALCHNDLVHTNLVGFDPVYLIDWEYAAIGDPLFDLAIVVRHHALADTVARDLVRAALGDLDQTTDERFRAQCELYDLLAQLWYAVMRQPTRSGPL